MNNYVKGLFYGVVTSATFGLIPLFSLPLMEAGMQIDSLLFYRFLMASVVLALIMVFNKESFRITRKQILPLIILGTFYTSSSMFLLWGYTFMDVGIATTLHFTYPIFVTLLMLLFFKEKPAITTVIAILMAVVGVGFLSITGGKFSIDILGMLLVLASALIYAFYIVAVNRTHLSEIKGTKLTFYVFSTCVVIFLLKALFFGDPGTDLQLIGGLQRVPDFSSLITILLLAIVPTVVSNIALVRAIHYVGGTLTSILGAMEPVTAVSLGVLVFHETLTFEIVVGILLILVAVSLIILSKPIQRRFAQLSSKLLQRNT